jgi:hypothetical protein
MEQAATAQASERLLYSRQSAAVALDLCPRSIDWLIEEGKLHVIRIGRRVLVTAESLKHFASSDHARIRPKSYSGNAQQSA